MLLWLVDSSPPRLRMGPRRTHVAQIGLTWTCCGLLLGVTKADPPSLPQTPTWVQLALWTFKV